MLRSLCFVVACLCTALASAADKPSISSTALEGELALFRLRRTASPHRDEKIVALAVEQQQADAAAGRPWSDGVLSDQKKPIARWYPVRDGREADYGGMFIVRKLPPQADGKVVTQILTVADAWNVNSFHIRSASAGIDSFGSPCVFFEMTEDGAVKLQHLTSSMLPDAAGQTSQLAIIFDGVVMSAPSVRGVISERGEINGRFTQREVEEMADVLSARKLVDKPAAKSPEAKP